MKLHPRVKEPLLAILFVTALYSRAYAAAEQTETERLIRKITPPDHFISSSLSQ